MYFRYDDNGNTVDRVSDREMQQAALETADHGRAKNGWHVLIHVDAPTIEGGGRLPKKFAHVRGPGDTFHTYRWRLDLDELREIMERGREATAGHAYEPHQVIEPE